MVGSGTTPCAIARSRISTLALMVPGFHITPRPEELRVLHELRMLGVDWETEFRYRNQRAWQYDVTRLGFRLPGSLT